MTFPDMVTQSVFARTLALIILALVMVAAILVATIDLLNNRAVPDIVSTILGIGVGTAGTILGINFGIILQPASTHEATVTSTIGATNHVSTNP